MAVGLVLLGLWLYSPEVWGAVVIGFFPSATLALLHGERLDIVSGRRLGLAVATKGNALAMAGTIMVPGRLAELFKPIYFRRRRSIPIMDGLSIVVVERSFDVIALSTLMLVAVALLAPDDVALLNASRFVAVFGLVTLFVGLAFVLKFPGGCRRVLNAVPGMRLSRFLISAFDSFQQGVSHGLSPRQIGLTILAWLGSWGLYWLFLQLDGGVALSFGQALVVFLVGSIGLTVAITPGGLGTFEAALAFVLHRYGYEVDAALASAVGLRVTALLPSICICMYMVLREGFEFGRIRDIARDMKDDRTST